MMGEFALFSPILRSEGGAPVKDWSLLRDAPAQPPVLPRAA